jgi:predicted aconitase with swiveling domain
MTTVLQGRPLVRGAAEGRLLVTRQPLSMWGGLDAATGRIIDPHHELQGQCVTGAILALPTGKGSSTASVVLLDAIRRRTAPAAIITAGVDMILTLASVVADEMWGEGIPVVLATEEDFSRLASSIRARIEEDGRIVLD